MAKGAVKFPLTNFVGDNGKPLFNAKIYIGEVDKNPRTEEFRKSVFVPQESGADIEIAQPVRTNEAGIPTYNGNPVELLVDGDYSMAVYSRNDVLEYYFPNVSESGLGPSGKTAPINVDNVTELRLLGVDDLIDGRVINLAGHTVLGIGGGQLVVKGNQTTEADNNGTLFVVNGKVIERIFSGPALITFFGAIGDGVTDDSPAFQSAVNAHTSVHAPACEVYYLIGDVTVPDGRTITGERVYKYTAFSVSDVSGCNSIVYNTEKSNFIDWGEDCIIKDCSFHGVDRTRPFLDGTRAKNIRMENCDVFRFSIGFGKESQGYTGNSRLFESHFSGNDIGISGLVDSHVLMCEVNANEGPGVRIQAGANDTVYLENKVEFNNEEGFEVFGGQSSVQIIAGIIDRNGKSGISITGNAGLNISEVKLRRNGRLAENGTPEEDSHIALRGGSTKRLIISGIQTATGANDDGSGYVSPSYSVVATNLASTVGSITGCDLTGSTDSENIKTASGGSLTIQRFLGNDVTEIDSDVTLEKATSNTNILSPNDVVFSGFVSNYSTATDVVIDGLPVTKTFSRTSYDLFLVTRNASSGSTIVQRYIATVSRESGNSSVILTNYIESDTNPVVTASVNADGTQITLTLTPESNTLQTEVVLTYFR